MNTGGPLQRNLMVSGYYDSKQFLKNLAHIFYSAISLRDNQLLETDVDRQEPVGRKFFPVQLDLSALFF